MPCSFHRPQKTMGTLPVQGFTLVLRRTLLSRTEQPIRIAMVPSLWILRLGAMSAILSHFMIHTLDLRRAHLGSRRGILLNYPCIWRTRATMNSGVHLPNNTAQCHCFTQIRSLLTRRIRCLWPDSSSIPMLAKSVFL